MDDFSSAGWINRQNPASYDADINEVAFLMDPCTARLIELCHFNFRAIWQPGCNVNVVEFLCRVSISAVVSSRTPECVCCVYKWSRLWTLHPSFWGGMGGPSLLARAFIGQKPSTGRGSVRVLWTSSRANTRPPIWTGGSVVQYFSRPGFPWPMAEAH